MDKEFTYRYLDIPNIKNELETFFKNTPIPETKFNILNLKTVLLSLPNITKWFISKSVIPSRVAYATVGPNASTDIHTDHGECALAINFPLYNNEIAKTYFYKCDEQYYEKVMGSSGYWYYRMPEEYSTEVDHYIMTQPVLLNLHYPHAVINTTDDYRYCLTFRFGKTPWHLIKN